MPPRLHRLDIQAKILITSCIMLVAALFIISLTVSEKQENLLTRTVINEIVTDSRMLANNISSMVFFRTWPNLDLAMQTFMQGRPDTLYYSIFDPEGRILACSNPDLIDKKDQDLDTVHSKSPNLVYLDFFVHRHSTKKARIVVFDRLIEQDFTIPEGIKSGKGQPAFLMIQEIYRRGHFLGYLKLYHTQRPLLEQIAETRKEIVLWGFASLLSALFLVWLVARRGLRPVKKLTSELAKLGSAPETKPISEQLEGIRINAIPSYSRDTDALKNSFARMRALLLENWRKLAEKNAELIRLNQLLEENSRNLENRVRERTRDLKDANESLKKENSIRKKAEAGLMASEHKYRTLVEGMMDGVFLLSKDKIRFANQSLCNMLGFQVNELTGMDCRQIIAPDHINRFQAFCNAAGTENRDQTRYEIDLAAKDGVKRVPVLFSVGLMPDEGEGERLLCTVKDITGVKKASREKTRLESELQQARKMQAVGTLAGGVAHSFNNILQAVSGYVQLMLMGKEETHPDFRPLRQVDASITRASQLVKQLLAFSRKMEPSVEPLDLNHEIKQAADILSHTLPKMIEIKLDLEKRPLPVMADGAQIEQVILNLASNARDAMPDGGLLSFTTRLVDLDRQFCTQGLNLKPGLHMLLTISDTGNGIPKEDLEHIFEPFFTSKEIGKGTGLGLSSSYGVIKSHGGHITCRSTLRKGTSFSIYLPALKDEFIPAPIPPKTDGLAAAGSETLLLVDDEETILEVLGAYLNELGYRVLYASSGEESLEIYQASFQDIALVVMDINMPGMGGKNCIREMRRINPEVKLIVASGYTGDNETQEALNIGALGYMAKPYSLTDFSVQVRHILDGGPGDSIITQATNRK